MGITTSANVQWRLWWLNNVGAEGYDPKKFTNIMLNTVSPRNWSSDSIRAAVVVIREKHIVVTREGKAAVIQTEFLAIVRRFQLGRLSKNSNETIER
jgi:hypothetical protein